MDTSDVPPPRMTRQPDPSAAAVRLADALAARLDAVVPAPFRVRAEGAWVSLYNDEAWDGSSDVAAVLDQAVGPDVRAGERGSFAWHAASVAEHVLSSVQDGVAEATAEPWPCLATGRMASSGARTDGERVYLWYGPDYAREEGAVVSFAPIALADLAGAA